MTFHDFKVSPCLEGRILVLEFSFEHPEAPLDNGQGRPKLVREMVEGLILYLVQAFEFYSGLFEGFNASLLKLSHFDKD